MVSPTPPTTPQSPRGFQFPAADTAHPLAASPALRVAG